MLRKTLTIASFFGLILSLGLWALSFWGVAYGAGSYGFKAFNGAMFIFRSSSGYDDKRIVANLTRHAKALQIYKVPAGWLIDDFKVRKTRWLPKFGSNITSSYSLLPLWIPTICFTATLLFIFLPPAFRRHKRIRLGLCLHCGYSLHGLTEPRCPECGVEFTPKDEVTT